jgi:hypothetical protein
LPLYWVLFFLGAAVARSYGLQGQLAHWKEVLGLWRLPDGFPLGAASSG